MRRALFTLSAVCFLAAGTGQAFSQDKAKPSEPAAPAAAPAAPPKIGLMPADFLDNVGQQTKARWRQLYRDAPPIPTAERFRVAFILGSLVTDSYLALEAGDAQKFKNNSQDVLNYCKVLGLGEKLSPNTLAGAKMAEREDWPAVRKQIADAQQMIEKLLNDQHDEDLATLVHLGLWMRLFEITTSIVVNDPQITNKTLCIGSMSLLNDIKGRFDKLAQTTRDDDSIAGIGRVLDVVQRHWESDNDHPTNETVTLTMEKLNYIMSRLTQK